MVKFTVHPSGNHAKEYPTFIEAAARGNNHLKVAICQVIKSRSVNMFGTPNKLSPRCFDGVIEPEQFYELTLEMIKADPKAAIEAFSAAAFKALDAAMHPPKPEPKPQPVAKVVSTLGVKRRPMNAEQTTNTAETATA